MSTAILFTGWWFGQYPESHIKIGVSRGTPRRHPAGYKMYRALQPGPWFKTASVADYRQLYFQGLAQLDPQAVVDDLIRLGGGRTPVMVCYENPADPAAWCHRGYISAWMADELGLIVPEYGHESEGHGWQHIKLPAQHRRLPAPPVKPIDISPWLGRRHVDRNNQTWEVTGRDSDHPDQAELTNVETGEVLPASKDVLESRFAQ